ncbi:hypothetical protein FISHEDRAFT_69630 [Fistulina hepatica ATCC 64428]|uniref:Uncharacterized protein n=1 Tax=Fistulina hepatica ATCC 64428 TaxID=1128425 RepID=A0A0D7AMN3_9AGAR|nr:hypothetical protein FISHEDRAFT_69630 [Fistulina hepatica ATCC 64428]
MSPTSTDSPNPTSSLTPSSNAVSSDLELSCDAELICLHRKVAWGNRINRELDVRSRKQKTRSTNLGRGFRQLVSLFDTPDIVVHMAKKYFARQREIEQRHNSQGPGTSQEDLDDAELTEEEKKAHDQEEYRTSKAYHTLMNLMPGLKEKLDDDTVDDDGFEDYFLSISRAGDAAKNTNMVEIRSAIADWLNKEINAELSMTDSEDHTSRPHSLEFHTRDFRGLANDKTGAYLAPVDLGDWNDPRYILFL